MSTSPTSDENPADSAADSAARESKPESVPESMPESQSVPETESAPARESDEVAGLRRDLAQAQDRHRRAAADLDNYRKRSEREGARRVSEARRSVVRDWLDAVDSVERALQMESGDPGLTAVLAQMDAILAREGVVRMDPVGSRFEPERHEAVAVRHSPETPDHTVLEVARSGYALEDGTVLRPAQVLVSRVQTGEG